MCFHILRLLHPGHWWPKASLELPSHTGHGYCSGHHTSGLHRLGEIRRRADLSPPVMGQLCRRHQLRHMFPSDYEPIRVDSDCSVILPSHKQILSSRGRCISNSCFSGQYGWRINSWLLDQTNRAIQSTHRASVSFRPTRHESLLLHLARTYHHSRVTSDISWRLCCRTDLKLMFRRTGSRCHGR